jgi:hypothetical protein
MVNIRLPGALFTTEHGTPYTVIASAYIEDDQIGYLLCAAKRPYYVYLLQYEDEFNSTFSRNRKTFENIVPAVAHYHEMTGCY